MIWLLFAYVFLQSQCGDNEAAAEGRSRETNKSIWVKTEQKLKSRVLWFFRNLVLCVFVGLEPSGLDFIASSAADWVEFRLPILLLQSNYTYSTYLFLQISLLFCCTSLYFHIYLTIYVCYSIFKILIQTETVFFSSVLSSLKLTQIQMFSP